MNRRSLPILTVLAALAALLAGALLAQSPQSQQPQYSQRQLSARFYFDLGPDAVDVSSYPPEQRANYQLFLKTCSQCHTPARAINAPFVRRSEWARYVQRMHIIAKQDSGPAISKSDAEAIISFLTYDAAWRKVEDKAAFDAQTEHLEAEFARIQQARPDIEIKQSEGEARQVPLSESGQPQEEPGPQP